MALDTNNKQFILKNFFEKRKLLIVVIWLFNIISMYTTQLGYSNAFSDGNNFFMSHIVPYGLAIGLGFILIYFSYQIIEQGINILVILIYLIVASVSIFFNFNAIYIASSESQNQSNYNIEITQKFNELVADAVYKIEIKVARLEEELSRLESVAEFERNRPTNSGRGPIYESKLEQYELKRAVNIPKINNYNNDINEINTIKMSVLDIPSHIQGREREDRIRMLFLDLINYTESRDIHNNSNYLEELADNNYDRGSLDYTLKVIEDTFKDILDGNRNTADTYRFFFSWFMAIFLDLIVFLVLIVDAFKKNTLPRTRRRKKRLPFNDNLYKGRNI